MTDELVDVEDEVKFISVRCDRENSPLPVGITVHFVGPTPSVNVNFADMPTSRLATSPDNVRGMWQYCMAWAINKAVKERGGSPRTATSIKTAINAGTEEVIAERAARL